jgi:hypothetical protein
MKTWPKVAIIVLNWNSYEDTKECLESLANITYPNYEVIVIDNASSDSSIDRLEKEFSQHIFIRNNENLGFAAGYNVGIRHALNSGDDYILILNNDMVVEERFLEPAVEIAEQNKQVGIVGGKIYYYDDPKRISVVWGKYRWFRWGVLPHGKNQIDKGQFDYPREVQFVTGAMMLVKQEVFKLVGLLPEAYFFWNEEWDFSYHVGKKGYKLYYVPRFIAWHKEARTYCRSDPKFIYNLYRSRFILLERILNPIGWKVYFFLFRLYYQFFAGWRLFRRLRGFVFDIRYGDLTKIIRLAIDDHKTEKKISLEDLERVGKIFTN